jgi:hypothetical protein
MKPPLTRWLLLLALAASVAVPPAPAARAQTPPAVRVEIDRTYAALVVGGVVVARWRSTRRVARAREAATRLTQSIAGEPPYVVEVRERRRAAEILVAGREVMVVDRAEAAANRSGLGDLARRWASALQRALALEPRITLSAAAVSLPVDGEAAVDVRGPIRGPLVVRAEDHAIVAAYAVATDGGGRRVVLRGRALGSTRVWVAHRDARRALWVSVRPVAGAVPEAVRVVVTGDPATADVVQEAIVRRVEQEVQLAPGAILEMVPPDGERVPRGESAVVPVKLRVRSPFALPVVGVVQAQVSNDAVALRDAGRLYISNNPERLDRDGVLFREPIEPDAPIRLLYHHKNGSPRDKVITVRILNPGSRASRLHLQVSSPRAWHDTMAVGHTATRRFLELLAFGRGYVVDVPAGGQFVFTAQRMPSNAVVSGLLQSQVLEGGPLEIVVAARTTYLLDQTVTRQLDRGEVPHPRGVFGAPVVDASGTLSTPAAATPSSAPGGPSVPGAEEGVDFGVSGRLRDLRTGQPLLGDYGVLTRLRLNLVNRTSAPFAGDLMFRAASGPAYATFVVNGEVRDLSFVRPRAEVALLPVTLAPQQSQTLDLLTIPEAASWYPVRLFLRAR